MGQKYTSINELYQQVRERVDLSEKIGDSSDMKRLSGELRNASKTHLAQSVRVKAHYDEMRKKVSDEVFRKLYTQFHGILNVYGDLERASKTHLAQAKKLAAFNKLKEFSDVTLTFQNGIEERVRFKLPSELVRSGEDGRTPARDKDCRV